MCSRTEIDKIIYKIRISIYSINYDSYNESFILSRKKLTCGTKSHESQ